MTTRLSLFDDMKRTDTSSRQRNEPFFAYLNRTADPEATEIRGRLESWFERFPVEARDDVRGRFRGDDDQDHRGAIFELFIHELLTRLDCMVEVHPDIPGKKARPDFIARHGDCSFYVEAKVIDLEKSPFAPNPLEEDIVAKINEMTSPHFYIFIARHGDCSFYVEAKVIDLEKSPFAPNPLEEDIVAKINEMTSPHFYIFAVVSGKLSTSLSREKVTRPFIELLDAHDPDEIQRLIDREGPFAAPSRTIKSVRRYHRPKASARDLVGYAVGESGFQDPLPVPVLTPAIEVSIHCHGPNVGGSIGHWPPVLAR